MVSIIQLPEIFRGKRKLLQSNLSIRTADRWRFARKPYCAASANVSHPDTLLSEMTAGHTLRRRMCSHLFFSVQWYLQVGGCWPRNALGEPELAYYLSAGHLLDSAFVLQLQPRYLCVHEVIAMEHERRESSGISHSPSVYAQKTWRLFP